MGTPRHDYHPPNEQSQAPHPVQGIFRRNLCSAVDLALSITVHYSLIWLLRSFGPARLCATARLKLFRIKFITLVCAHRNHEVYLRYALAFSVPIEPLSMDDFSSVQL